jgi:hypothetical protein
VISAVIGAVISFVAGVFLGLIPLFGLFLAPLFAPLSGGFAAGYLRGSDVRESALTGFLANVLASIPTALLVGIFLLVGGISALTEGAGEAALGLIVWLIIFAVAFVMFYLMGALGGAIGAKVTDRGSPGSD